MLKGLFHKLTHFTLVLAFIYEEIEILSLGMDIIQPVCYRFVFRIACIDFSCFVLLVDLFVDGKVSYYSRYVYSAQE